MKRLFAVLFAVVVGLAFCPKIAFSASVGVSPGGAGTSPACPTFSWGSVEGSVSYQLAVYESPGGDLTSLEDVDALTGGPTLAHTVPAQALSWTPSSGQCLAEGNYLWYVRGVDGEGDGAWSPGTAFEVGAPLTEAEFEERVASALDKYLARQRLAASGSFEGKSLYEIVNGADSGKPDGMVKAPGPSLLPKSSVTLLATEPASIYLDGNVTLANGGGRVGIGTDQISAGLHVESNDGVLFEGNVGQGTIPKEGAGTRMMWYPRKSAFRVGTTGLADWNDTNVGSDSVAMGNSTKATAPYSFATGNQSVASAYAGTAMGTLTTAAGNNSTALGYGTTASAYGETALGLFNTLATSPTAGTPIPTDRLLVIGNGDSTTRSDAMVVLKNGNTTVNGTVTATSFSGDGSGLTGVAVSESDPQVGAVSNGLWCRGDGSAVQCTESAPVTTETDPQVGTIAAGYVPRWDGSAGELVTGGIYDNGSGRVGIGTDNVLAGLHVTSNEGVLFEGTYGQGTIPKEGAGTRMMWYPAKAAFRVGVISRSPQDQWDEAFVGVSSVAMGNSTKATGPSSTAMGSATLADNTYATAMGFNTKATGNSSTAMGYVTTASGLASTAMGFWTKAESFGETAVGYFNTLATSPTPDSPIATDRLLVIGNGQDQNNPSDAMVVLKNGNVGIGTATPGVVLDVAGSVRLGAEGSVIQAVQSGTDGLGPCAGGKASWLITFPTSFAAAPRVIASVRNSGTFTDVFAFSISEVTTDGFKVTVFRVDVAGGNWGQSPLLDWVAIQ